MEDTLPPQKPGWFTKNIKLIIVAILVISLPVALILVQRSADIRQQAANNLKDAVESESGNLNGPVSIGNDTGASDGKYILFGSAAVTQAPTSTSAPVPTGQTNPTAVPTNIPGGATLPSQIIDLTNWKITVPIGASKPTEILPPAILSYKLDPWFIVAPGQNAVRFRAPVNSPSTTTNSSYPRSELREMKGTALASWSPTSGTHTLEIEQAVTAIPKYKKHVVVGQIHDSGDDVTVFRLEGDTSGKNTLYVTKGDDTHYAVAATDYVLGTKFTVKFVVAGGQIKAYYNNVLKATIPHTNSGNYFKAGMYTQSNCIREKEYGGSDADCNSNNYGEAIVYRTVVTHQ